MREAFVIAAVFAVCATPAVAGSRQSERLPSNISAHAIQSNFDLTSAGRSKLARADAVPVSQPAPRGIDMHRGQWTPPAIEVALAENGPVFAAGAMGSRRKGVPKLAHVAINWNF